MKKRIGSMATTKAKRKTSKPKTVKTWAREVKSAKKAVSNAENKIRAARRLIKKQIAAGTYETPDKIDAAVTAKADEIMQE